MKRLLAVILVLGMMVGVTVAKADDRYAVTEIIKLKSEPASYLVEYTAESLVGWWDNEIYWDLVDANGDTIKEHFAEYVRDFDGCRYEVEVGKLWGILDAAGEWIVQPRYDYISSLYDGLAKVEENGLYGYINFETEQIIEPRFEEAGNFSNGYAEVKLNGKCGMIGTDGEFVIEPLFESIYGFYNDVALVKLDGLTGLMDKNGNYITEPIYNVSGWAQEADGNLEYVIIYRTEPTGKCLYGYLFGDGSVIEPRFDKTSGFSDEGLAAVRVDNAWGYINRTGEYVIEPIYENCSLFAQGLAPVCLNGLWGYIDTNGKYVFEPQFDYAESFYYHKYPTVWVGNYCGAVNSNGEYAVLPWLESLKGFSYGYAAAMHDGLWGIIDENGFWAVDPVYAVIGDYNDVCAVVSMDERAELWDVNNVAPGAGLVSLPDGEILLELGHDDISIAYDDGTINAVKDGVKHIYKLNNGKLGEVTVVDSSLDLRVYMPNEGEKVAFLEDGADIKWDVDAPLPRLDGATALLPVYAAFAQATYPDTLRYSGLDVTTADDFELSEDSIGHVSDILFTCTKTAEAYDRLIDGETDIIFCAGPSEKEALLARLKGEELELTLMGYEAFVFIVNADNPISDITVEQIKKIYSGEITSWADLGHEELGNIIAYQRPENSGSQTALEKLMGDTPLMEAPEYVVDSMTMIVDNIEYRNLENSIGYSFRFFVSGMMGSDVKLLQIDGVAPTEENIRNSSYPLITPIYAVTRKGDANPNVRILLDWITDPQGQELVEKSGYVGLGN